MENIRVKNESLNNWREEFNINEEIQGGVSVENYADGVQFNEIETVDIIKPKALDPSNWRSEMQILEGNRTRYKGVSILGSGNKKSMDLGPNEKAPLDRTKIQAKADKKKEVIAASNEIEGEVFVEDYMTDLYNEGYSVDEINEYLLEEYEIDEEYLEEAWGKVLKGLGQVAGQALKKIGSNAARGGVYATTRAVKDTGTTIGAAKKVAKFVTNPTNLARANKDTQKVIDTGTSIVKGGKEAMARTYAAGQKFRKIVDSSGKNLLAPAKSLKQLQADIKKVNRQGNISVIKSQIKGETGLGVADNFRKGYSKRLTDANARYVKRQQTATKTKVEPKLTKVKSPVKQISSSRPFKDHPTSKGLTYQQKQAKANNIIAKTQGKTPKQIKAKEVSARIEKGYNRNLEKTGDKIIKDIKATPIPKEKAIVKNPGGKITPSPSGSLAKTTDKGSAIVKNSGGKLTKEVTPNNRKLSAKDRLTRAGSGTKGSGTTYASTSKPPLRLPPGGPDEDKVRAAVAGASFGLGGYAGTKVFGKKEKKEVKEGVASVVAKTIPWGKVATKVGGAVLAAKGGEKILKDLLGTPDQPKKTDWDKNPKDKIDQELNVKQGQAKDAAKNKSFDDEMKAYRKGKENLTDIEKIERLKSNAGLKKTKKTKKESFSDWRSEINL